MANTFSKSSYVLNKGVLVCFCINEKHLCGVRSTMWILPIQIILQYKHIFLSSFTSKICLPFAGFHKQRPSGWSLYLDVPFLKSGFSSVSAVCISQKTDSAVPHRGSPPWRCCFYTLNPSATASSALKGSARMLRFHRSGNFSEEGFRPRANRDW